MRRALVNTKWIENARARFIAVYGEKRGAAVCNVVVPAVMGDFRKTVLAAERGTTVTEQYRTDDKKTGVTVTGYAEKREGRPVCVITRIEIGGTPIDLGAAELVL